MKMMNMFDKQTIPHNIHKAILAATVAAVVSIASASSSHAGETSIWETKKGTTSASLAATVVDKTLYDTEYGRKWGLRTSSVLSLPDGKMQIVTFWRIYAISNLDDDGIYRCIDVIDVASGATISATCSTPMLPD